MGSCLKDLSLLCDWDALVFLSMNLVPAGASIFGHHIMSPLAQFTLHVSTIRCEKVRFFLLICFENAFLRQPTRCLLSWHSDLGLELQWATFTMPSILLEYFHEHHLPRYHVDLNLKSVHC